MIRAKNYKTVTKFVKVIQEYCGLFFSGTLCILTVPHNPTRSNTFLLLLTRIQTLK